MLNIKGDINTTKNENSKFPLKYFNILVCKIRPGLEDIIFNKKEELTRLKCPMQKQGHKRKSTSV